MYRPCYRLLLPALLLAGLALGAIAQGPQDAKKGDGKKSEPGKGKDSGAGKANSEPWPFPPGSVIVVPKDFAKGLPTWPGVVVQRLEDYQKLKAAADKQKAKPEKQLAHSCELSGRLDGDYVALRGEFTFATEEPRATVKLGLQGGQLTEKGELDGKVPLLDYSDADGFTVRVDEPGNHRLVLHLRARVKRAAGGTGQERALELGLPGTVITTIALELPASIKEVRCGDAQEKTRTPGRWQFALGRKETLNLSWREPAPQRGGGPDLSVTGKVKVSLLGADPDMSAELELVDPRGQTKECQLVVPAQAEVKVEPPPGLSYELIAPGPKNPNYVLRFLEPNTEPWKVTMFAHLPRPAPGGRLAVGPFYVPGTKKQTGTIAIEAPAAMLRKQRLIYYRHGDVFQGDVPKGQDKVEALFRYWRLPDPSAKAPAARVPLEIEVRSERGPLEAAVEQVLKLRPGGGGCEIELTAQVTVRSPGGADFLDLQLPRPRPTGMALFAAAPASGLAGGVPWAALALLRGAWPAWAMPLDFQLSDDAGRVLDLPPVDGHGRCRLPRALGKGSPLKLTGRYVVAADHGRVRVDLPRVLGLVEQGSKVTIQADEALELLDGPAGWEMPVPAKHRYEYPVDATPPFVDVAWRRYRPEVPATAVVDVVIHGWTAHVRERLSYGALPPSGGAWPARLGHVGLSVPAEVRGLTAVYDSKREPLVPDRRTRVVWLTPRGDNAKEVVLEYDVRLSGQAADVGKDEPRALDLRMVWPRGVTRQQAKVRVWCAPGSRLRVPADGLWRDRGVEPVADHDMLPALVVEADGPNLLLALQCDRTAGGSVAPLVCERGLIAADVGDDGGLACRARYVVGKVNADAITVEFPVALGVCSPEVQFGGRKIAWQQVEDNPRAVRVPLPTVVAAPLVLDIKYQLPPATQQGRAFGLVTLIPPMLSAPVRHLRWHVNLPSGDVLAMPLAAGARPEYRWGWDRMLLSPEPAVAPADLEAWLAGKGAVADSRPSGLTFGSAASEPQRVYFLPRLLWLVAVSVLAVVLFLVLYFLRLSRLVVVVLISLAALAGLALALTWPALLVAICYGAQPGVAVVVFVLIVLWAWQKRYRHQLVFIPGFTRLKAGSSLVRNGKSSKRPREASTIDAPTPAAPSSISGAGSGSKK